MKKIEIKMKKIPIYINQLNYMYYKQKLGAKKIAELIKCKESKIYNHFNHGTELGQNEINELENIFIERLQNEINIILFSE